MQHQRGFTLAEVLITMGIIGVVAALTIPSMSTAYQKRVLTTQLQKSFAEMSHAAGMVIADEVTNDFINSKAMRNDRFMGKYLNVGNINYNYQSVLASTYESVDPAWEYYNGYSPSDILGSNYTCGKMKSGAAVCLNRGGYGFLDVNGGDKAPNQIGRDAFLITFRKNGSLHPYDPFLTNIMSNDWDLDSAH